MAVFDFGAQNEIDNRYPVQPPFNTIEPEVLPIQPTPKYTPPPPRRQVRLPIPLINIAGQTRLTNGAMISPNFKTGEAGWAIDAEGNAEFNSGVFRGRFEIGGTTITIDNTQDIQENLDLIYTEGGGTLFLQPGTYLLTADISIPSGVTLQGVSRDGVIIDCNTSYKVQIVGSDAYITGTVTISNGDTEVVGDSTVWTDAMIGQLILLDGIWYEITGRTDNTHIDIETYNGSDLSGATYTIATTNDLAQLKNVTIQNATGAGLKIQYCNESNLYNVQIFDCGTGLDIDQSLYSYFYNVFCDGNGINLDANEMYSFEITFSEFDNSTTGAGIKMVSCGDATIFDTGLYGNFGNGMEFTSSRNIAFMSMDVSSNGDNGIESISGNTDFQFTSVQATTNTNDGYSLTATSDNFGIVNCSIKDNGGYGINIVASTCDNNQIISPAFSGNVSGNINDAGTNTVVLPSESSIFVAQDIVIAATTAALRAVYKITSTTDGNTIIMAESDNNDLWISRFVKETSGGSYYKTHGPTLFPDSSMILKGIAIIGTYVYISYTLFGANTLRRYNIADLTSGTNITFSGTSRSGLMFSDETNLYIYNGTSGQFDKFTISGTVATNAGAISYTSAGTPTCAVGNANNCWISDDNGTAAWDIRKYALTGGAVLSTTSPNFAINAYVNGSQPQFFFGNELTLGLGWFFQMTSEGAKTGQMIKVKGIELP